MFLSEEWVSLIFLFVHLKHTSLVFFRAATVWGNTIQYLEDPVSIADGTLLIMSVHLLVLHSSPAWIESTLQFHLSPEVGTVHQGKFWLAEKQMERRVHCQGSCRVYKKDVKVVSVFVRGQTLEGNRGEGWTRNKKEYTRMCRHVAKTHIYHDL